MEYLRRFLQKMNLAPSDEQLGRRASVYPEDGRRSTVVAPGLEPGETMDPNAILETSTKLMEFRMIIGSES